MNIEAIKLNEIISEKADKSLLLNRQIDSPSKYMQNLFSKPAAM